MRRGTPTKDHEDKIDEFCNKGFKRFGFCAWFKSIGIWSSLGDSCNLPIFDFEDNFVAFTDGLSNAKKMKTKRTIARLQSFIPAFVDYETGHELSADDYAQLPDEEKCFYIEPYINFESVSLWFGHSEIDPKNLSEVTRCMSVIPDCWSYNNKEKIVHIVEVTDRCHLSYVRLKKYAAIDDLLFEWAGIRLDLKEVQLKGGVISHDLETVFEMSIDCGDMYGEPEDENDALKWYFKNKAP